MFFVHFQLGIELGLRLRTANKHVLFPNWHKEQTGEAVDRDEANDAASSEKRFVQSTGSCDERVIHWDFKSFYKLRFDILLAWATMVVSASWELSAKRHGRLARKESTSSLNSSAPFSRSPNRKFCHSSTARTWFTTMRIEAARAARQTVTPHIRDAVSRSSNLRWENTRSLCKVSCRLVLAEVLRDNETLDL